MLSKSFIKECFETKKSLIGNNEFVNFLKKNFPVKIHKFKSGTSVYDWKIPKKWLVKKGQLKSLEGEVLLDYETNCLSLLTHSRSIVTILKTGDFALVKSSTKNS